MKILSNVTDQNMEGFNDILENTSIGKITKEITGIKYW